jgi:hypothetical protein
LIVLTHVLPLERVAPASAVAAWFLSLCLRALGAVALAGYVPLYLPQKPVFDTVAAWCLDVTTPVAGMHVHVPGSRLAQGLAVLPTLLLAASLGWAAFRLLQARICVRHILRRQAVGDGPLGSTLVATEEVLLAVTQLGPPRLLISRRTIETMDADELDAGLQHELGHLRRGHRRILFLAAVLRALSRWQPGARAAYRELCFSLERDADEYALRQTVDPLALASAICKAALSPAGRLPATGLRGESRVSLRLESLLAGGSGRAAVPVERATRLLAVSMLALTLFLAVAAPAWAIVGPGCLPHLPSTSGWAC